MLMEAGAVGIRVLCSAVIPVGVLSWHLSLRARVIESSVTPANDPAPDSAPMHVGFEHLSLTTGWRSHGLEPSSQPAGRVPAASAEQHGAMDWGIHLPHLGRDVSPDVLVDFARRSEAAGCHAAWVSDRVAWRAAIESAYPYSHEGAFPAPPDVAWLDPLGTLFFVAR
jgi:hypothetical protein